MQTLSPLTESTNKSKRVSQALLEELIPIHSLSSHEAEALKLLESTFQKFDWKFERIPVGPQNYNIFVPFSNNPRLVYSTHVDVVPAPADLFRVVQDGNRIIGRGSCDAKGILCCMIEALLEITRRGFKDCALLVLVEEETSGQGARVAASALAERGIEWVVNGEPTQGKMMRAHKGALDFTISIPGKSCHSGYPELGIDANLRMLDIAAKLQQLDFGSDPDLGKATLNLGVMQGGISSNIVSGSARINACVRTTGPHEKVIQQLHAVLPDDCSLEFGFNSPPVKLLTLDGFETDVAAYCTDIPGLSALGSEFMLIGPGSIHRAHTDFEWIELAEMEQAVETYVSLAARLLPSNF